MADLDTIFAVAKSLLPGLAIRGERIRLVGVSVSDLATGPTQASLFPDPERERRAKLQQLAHAVESRFGEGGLTRATLLTPELPTVRKPSR